jgi:type IV secretion system protein TrbI
MTEPEKATIQQRSQAPPGSIPRNRQSIIMVTVAVVIVLAVVFSGSTQPQPRADPNTSMMSVRTPSKAEIDRYTQALRAEEERLRQAQAEASRSRATFQKQVGADVQGGIPGEAITGPNGQLYYPASPYAQQTPTADPIQQDREKREYASLFASNVVLSYRKAPAVNAVTPGINVRESQKPAEGDSSRLSADSITPEMMPLPSGNNSARPPTGNAETSRVAVRPGDYALFEGTIIEAVLTNRLEGSFAGPVNCQITTDVYSNDRQQLLIPKGSRVLGEARRVEDRDQARLAVIFHRIIMPDGYYVNLDRILGLDQAGASALKDKVNKQYLSTFGTSIALGLLAGFSMYGTGGMFTSEASDVYRQGIANQLGRDATRILDRSLNRLPSITIREGTRVRILLANDISLPAYYQHPPTPGF